MLRKVLATATAIASLNAPFALGLGLGSVDLKSALNEPLVAEIKVKDVQQLQGKMFRIGLASERAFAFSGIDRTALLAKLRFELDEDRGLILVTSTEPVTESYLNFLLEIAWDTNSITREYTFLLDLPVLSTEASPALISSSESSKPAIKKLGNEPKFSHQVKVEMPRSRQVDDGEYEVKNADTLWAVARNNRPSKDVSIDVMAEAIYQANPDAFIDGDRDRLMRGAVLVIPGEVDNVAPIKRDAAVGTITEKTSQSKRNAPDASLTVVAGESANSIQLAEQVDALKNEKAQLTDQLGALEEQNTAMNALLEAQSAELARLQALLDSQDQQEVATTESDEVVLDDTPVLVETAPESVVDTADEATAAEEPQPVVAKDEAPKQSLVVAKSAEKAWYEKPFWWAVGGGAALLALVAMLFARARQRKLEQEAEINAALAPVEASDDVKGILAEARKDGFDDGDVDVEVDEASLESSLADYYESVDQELVEEAPEDAVAAAEGYLAFEQYQQARDVLESALDRDETDNDVRLKLLEVLAITGDHDAFDEHADVLNIANDEQVETHIDALRASMPQREVDPAEQDADVDSELEVYSDTSDDEYVQSLVDEQTDVLLESDLDVEDTEQDSFELDVESAEQDSLELDVERAEQGSLELDVAEVDGLSQSDLSIELTDEAAELPEAKDAVDTADIAESDDSAEVADEQPLTGRAAALAGGISEADLSLDIEDIYAFNGVEQAESLAESEDSVSSDELDESYAAGESFAAQYLDDEEPTQTAVQENTAPHASSQSVDEVEPEASTANSLDDELVELNFSVQYTPTDTSPVDEGALVAEAAQDDVPSPDDFELAIEQDGPKTQESMDVSEEPDGTLEFDLSGIDVAKEASAESSVDETIELAEDDSGIEFVVDELDSSAKASEDDSWTTDDEYISGLDESFTEENDSGLSIADETELAAISSLETDDASNSDMDLESDLANLDSLNDLEGLDEISDSFSDLDAELELDGASSPAELTIEELGDASESELLLDDETVEPKADIDEFAAEISELNSNLGDAVQREIDEADVTIEAPKDAALLEGVDEIATKIDLARAYLDMDDVDGAIELLEEVVAEADGELKAEAKSLLDSL